MYLYLWFKQPVALCTVGDLSAQLSRELEEVERSATPEELPCYLPALMGCRNVEENYDYLNKIEEGTYGVVHRAKDKKSGELERDINMSWEWIDEVEGN